MQVDHKITVTITRDELTEIIAEYLNNRGLIQTGISFKIEESWRGHGPGEHKVINFSCVKSDCVQAKPKSISSLASQISAVESSAGLDR